MTVYDAALFYFFDSLMKDYFYKPPINKLSLTFLENSLESAYRISYQEEVSLCQHDKYMFIHTKYEFLCASFLSQKYKETP